MDLLLLCSLSISSAKDDPDEPDDPVEEDSLWDEVEDGSSLEDVDEGVKVASAVCPATWAVTTLVTVTCNGAAETAAAKSDKATVNESCIFNECVSKE